MSAGLDQDENARDKARADRRRDLRARGGGGRQAGSPAVRRHRRRGHRRRTRGRRPARQDGRRRPGAARLDAAGRVQPAVRLPPATLSVQQGAGRPGRSRRPAPCSAESLKRLRDEDGAPPSGSAASSRQYAVGGRQRIARDTLPTASCLLPTAQDPRQHRQVDVRARQDDRRVSRRRTARVRPPPPPLRRRPLPRQSGDRAAARPRIAPRRSSSVTVVIRRTSAWMIGNAMLSGSMLPASPSAIVGPTSTSTMRPAASDAANGWQASASTPTTSTSGRVA